MVDEIFFSARDGARLYGRRYRGQNTRRPLLCLPSLVGNSTEFDALAQVLSRNGPDSRTVYTIDCRGRGRSSRTGRKTPASLLTDCEDVLEYMTLTGLTDAAVIGSGHGGQLAMVLALLRPRAVGALVLSDSAPEFEVEGVVRMLSELINLPIAANWDEAARLLKGLHGRRYPGLSEDQWSILAHSRFGEADGRPVRAFDPAVASSHSLSNGAYRQTLWPQFAAMSRVPMLLLRAELSDMISPSTAARMQELHPNLVVASVANQGHPILLRDGATLNLVSKFLSNHEWQAAGSDLPLKAVA